VRHVVGDILLRRHATELTAAFKSIGQVATGLPRLTR